MKQLILLLAICSAASAQELRPSKDGVGRIAIFTTIYPVHTIYVDEIKATPAP